ncbi:MAG: dihydrodipicolinate synthase family protein, partial [Gammaproteobacteria bacterium]|nr:dihydrodipicolinate synthase family protein [Gammaproteobacteria bacterium]
MASPLFTFEGIYTPIITPFHKSGEINFDTLGEIIEFLIEQGVQGLIS